MADRDAWGDHARGREDHWRHPCFRWKLDANLATHPLRVLMARGLFSRRLLVGLILITLSRLGRTFSDHSDPPRTLSRTPSIDMYHWTVVT